MAGAMTVPVLGALGAGAVLLLAGGLVLLAARRRSAEDGLGFIGGLLAGSGLAFFAVVTLATVELPRDAVYGPARSGIIQSAAPQYVVYGNVLTKEVQAYGAWVRVNAYYFVPCAAILLVLIHCLTWRKVFRALFGLDFAQFLGGFSVAMLIPLAVLAASNYTAWGNFRSGNYLNPYEFYHYYIGTKYGPEVGYSGMYEASLVADAETGPVYKGSEQIRDLSTGMHVKAETVLKNPKKMEEIKAKFSPERWQEFLKDTRYFKRVLMNGRWLSILNDKGYNGTPYWSMWVGGLLSERVDTDNETGMLLLSLLDPALICIALACVWWVFGLTPMLLMIILIGTSYVMSFTHMKGAYLRTDFAMALVVAVCMLKRRHFATAGALMMYAALSRLFPAAFFFGAGVKLLQNVVRHWRPRPRRLLAGLNLALVLTLLIAPALYFGAPATWRAALVQTRPGAVLHMPAVRVAQLTLPKVNTSAAPADQAKAVEALQHRAQRVAEVLLSLIVAVLAAHGLAALWLFRDAPECRPYVRLFASALAVLVLASAAVMADPRTGKACVEDFTSKIGRHLSDISVWRIGYKYLFINRPQVQAERYASLAPAAPVETPSALPDAPGAPVKPAAKKPAAPAPKDEQGFLRVPLSTVRDMQYAWARAWEDAGQGVTLSRQKNRPAGETPKAAGPTTGAARVSLAVRNFFFRYEPIVIGAIYNERSLEWQVTMLLVLILSFFAVLGLKDHEALAWSFVPTFFLVSETYYYYIMLAVPLLFFSTAVQRPSRALGTVMLLATAMPGYYLNYKLGWGQDFPTYYWYSVMLLFVCLYMMLLGYADGLRWLFGKRQDTEA